MYTGFEYGKYVLYAMKIYILLYIRIAISFSLSFFKMIHKEMTPSNTMFWIGERRSLQNKCNSLEWYKNCSHIRTVLEVAEHVVRMDWEGSRSGEGN